MRKYESIVVFSPELNKEQLSTEIAKVKDILKGFNALEVFVEEWGKRKIAYVAKKQTQGFYVCFYYEAENMKVIEELVYNLRINDAVLKFQTHHISDKADKYRGNMAFVRSSKSDEMVASDIDELEISDLGDN